MSKWSAGTSPRLKARIAGAFNLLAMVAGIFASFLAQGRLGFTAELLAGACNLVVTLLLYDIFRPVSRTLSSLAAFFGILVSLIGAFRWHPHGLDVGLLCFGAYCLLIGYLIFRSTFLPRILGGLVALAGLAWLTFLVPPLTHSLSPYNMAIGVLGQLSLTLWLLVFGVSAQRWKRRSGATAELETA